MINCLRKYNNFYSEKKIKNFLNDLSSNVIAIKDERISTSSQNVANEIDKIAYSYGYIDFGRDSIVYNSSFKKKIVIWTEILEYGEDTLVKALAFLIEIFLSINEEKIYMNYDMLRKSIKINNKFEYTMLTDFSDGNMPAIGGFRKSILDKWCCYLDFASADLISSYITEKNYILHKRTNFLKTLLKIHNYSIEDLVVNKRNDNLDFIEKMIPKDYCTKISLLSTVMENTDNSTRYLLSKYQLENQIYRYISYLFYENKLQRFSNDEQENLIEELLSQCNTLYNPDIKLNCGII